MLIDLLPRYRSQYSETLAAGLVALAQEQSPEFPTLVSLRKHFRDSAIISCDLPAEIGGADEDLLSTLCIFHDVGTHDLNLRDLPGGGHGRMLLYASDYESGKYDLPLTSLGRGDAFFALAITEKGAGSAVTHLETTYERVGNQYVLHGAKECLGRFQFATHLIVLARAKDDRTRLTAFLVSLPCDGMSFESRPSKGLTAVNWGDLKLSQVRIPSTAVIGREGEGRVLFDHHFAHWRLTMTAASVGCAVQGLLKTSDWLSRRSVGSRVLADESLVQSDFSEYVYRLRAVWLMLADASGTQDHNSINLIKGQGIDDCLSVLNWCQSVVGRFSYGYQDGNLDISKRREDVRGLTISSGATETLKLAFARSQFESRPS